MKLSEFKQLIKQSIREEKEKEKNTSGKMTPEEEKMVADYEEEEANKHALDSERPMEEGNLGHNETASLEPEGRFWIVSWRGMDGPKEKVFTDEDEAREFMDNLNKPTPEIPGFEGTKAALDDLFEEEQFIKKMKRRAGIIK